MPELRHLAADLAAGDLADLAEVRAGGEDERLAGDRDAADLPGGRPGGEAVERVRELQEGGRPEGGGPRVVAAVVERDEREHAAGGQRHVADERVRDDLVGIERHELPEAAGVGHLVLFLLPVKCGFSQMTLPPWPRPTHIAVRP